jgi:hypothetical protein
VCIDAISGRGNHRVTAYVRSPTDPCRVALQKLMAICLCTGVVAGCGGRDDPGEHVRGKLTHKDLKAAGAIPESGHIQALAALIEADAQHNVRRLRRAEKRLAKSVREVQRLRPEFDNRELRSFVGGGYSAALRRLVAVAKRYPRRWDPLLGDRLSRDLRRAGTAVRRADRALLGKLLAEASPEQREDLRARLRLFYEDRERAAQPG